jgi:hypothetical protein
MKPYRKFRSFQIRWKEALGKPECPYLYRWTFIFFGFSIRIHHWLKSDDRRFFHDHSCDFVSIILKGKYKNVTPDGEVEVKAGQSWKSNAEARHYLDIPKEGAWTLLLCGRKRRNWGFWDKDNHMLRPLEYFHRYGTIQDENYQ